MAFVGLSLLRMSQDWPLEFRETQNKYSFATVLQHWLGKTLAVSVLTLSEAESASYTGLQGNYQSLAEWANGCFISPVLIWENLEIIPCSPFQYSCDQNRELSRMYNKLICQRFSNKKKPCSLLLITHPYILQNWSFINTLAFLSDIWNVIAEMKSSLDVFSVWKDCESKKLVQLIDNEVSQLEQ